MTYGSLYGTNHVVSNPNTIEAEMSENTGKGTCQSELSQVHRITSMYRCIGMQLDRIKGSHHIYRLLNPFLLVSIQKMKDGKAKPYQVRQVLNLIDDNNLMDEEQS